MITSFTPISLYHFPQSRPDITVRPALLWFENPDKKKWLKARVLKCKLNMAI
jgi:hypothetical protein